MIKYRNVLKRKRIFPLSIWALVHVEEPVPSMWANKETRNDTGRVPTTWPLVHILSFKVRVFLQNGKCLHLTDKIMTDQRSSATCQSHIVQNRGRICIQVLPGIKGPTWMDPLMNCI